MQTIHPLIKLSIARTDDALTIYCCGI